MALMVVISTALALIKPHITVFGEHLSFHATDPELLIIPVIIIPIAFTLRLIIYKKPFATFVPIVLTVAVTFACIIYLSGRFDALFNPISLVSLLILSWFILVIVLRHICVKRSLVGQSRTY
jgi:hypothetical protein